MNEINVIVNYVRPTTNKFDALMNQYNEVKQLSKETVSYYKPLAEMAEEAKLNAILAQLETIKAYLKKLNDINGNNREVWCCGTKVTVSSMPYFKLKINADGEIYITWHDEPFTIKSYRNNPHFFNNQWYDDWNILGNWDKWNCYENLEKRCISMLNGEIEKQKNKAMAQVERLKNITGEL